MSHDHITDEAIIEAAQMKANLLKRQVNMFVREDTTLRRWDTLGAVVSVEILVLYEDAQAVQDEWNAEAPKEIAERMKKEEARLERVRLNKKKVEEEERLLYARLKAKFESGRDWSDDPADTGEPT